MPPPVEIPTCLASSDLEEREDNGSHGWEMLEREEATKVPGNELFKWGAKAPFLLMTGCQQDLSHLNNAFCKRHHSARVRLAGYF